MNQVNKVTLDFRDNPELKEAFAGKQPGDKCKFTVELQINEISDDGLVGTVEEIETRSEYKDRHGGDDAAVPDSESPVMLAIVRSE